MLDSSHAIDAIDNKLKDKTNSQVIDISAWVEMCQYSPFIDSCGLTGVTSWRCFQFCH